MATFAIINADGFIENKSVQVQFFDDGTVRIGRTVHCIDDLEISEDGHTIKHLASGSTLTKN
jgi:hypothetical protein